MLGNEESDLIGNRFSLRFGLFLQNGNPHFRLRGFDLHGQTPIQSRNQPVLQTFNRFRVGVAGNHNLLACFYQGIEQIEKLFLGSIFTFQKLDVIK